MERVPMDVIHLQLDIVQRASTQGDQILELKIAQKVAPGFSYKWTFSKMAT